ncbi:MAG: hypothetical protein K8R23_10525 [Chthoniobacter sp.]|nr:hypothetical protein [Chthoniobacter sp.]
MADAHTDKATEYSLKYIQLIEDILPIEWTPGRQPSCVVERITENSLILLSNELDDLCSSSDRREGALQASREFGQLNVQTVGFGHASDFDEFVKLGLIFGDRIVLWDVISSKVIRKGAVNIESASLVAQIACNLLLLKPVIEKGGIVILPHPTRWSDLTKNVCAALQEFSVFSDKEFGLATALCVIEEGLPVHPYTLLHDDVSFSATSKIIDKDELYSGGPLLLNKAIASLLSDQRFRYLSDVSLADFHRIISRDQEVRRSIRRLFTSPLHGLSHVQANQEIEAIKEDLFARITKQNTSLADYSLGALQTTASFSLSAYSVAVASAPLTALAIAGLGVNLWGVLQKWLKKPQEDVLIQAFKRLKEVISSGDESSFISGETCSSYANDFLALPWTEDRQKYLSHLPRAAAIQLLRGIDESGLEIVVNHRRFQEDYIGDYLKYVSEIDLKSYWAHIEAMFKSPEGILIYDGTSHVEMMTSHDMPERVWLALLASVINAHRNLLRSGKEWFELTLLKQIINYQINCSAGKTRKRELLETWISSLSEPDRVMAAKYIEEYSDKW